MILSARTFWSLPGTGFTLLTLRLSNPHTFLMMILQTFPSFMIQGNEGFVIWLQRYYRTIIKIYSFYLSYRSISPLLRILLCCTYFSFNKPVVHGTLRLSFFYITTNKWLQSHQQQTTLSCWSCFYVSPCLNNFFFLLISEIL